MRLIFIIGAIVLIVFAIIASANLAATFLGVAWTTWLCASLLSFLTSLLVDHLGPLVVTKEN